MNKSDLCLPAGQIESLLSDSLSPDELQVAEVHIAECQICRDQVERAIGSSHWWDELSQSLFDSHLNGQMENSLPQENSAENQIPSSSAIRELVRLLGPTDDPRMMGRIGAYEIAGVLGQGGMGVVFKGLDRSLNRFVAIKMLSSQLASSVAARKRFAREGRAIAAVVNDHVMAIHGVDQWQDIPYLVMPYTRGESLQKRLNNSGPLSIRETLRIGAQTAKGLAAAHAQGIIHRDIKPANIFLDESVERVQLMDFGLAMAIDDASLTRTGALAGTPQYMSPEQAKGELTSPQSDLFSLGSVMYAMCTGRAPFVAETSFGILSQIAEKEPRFIREINPDIPDWLCALIGKLMAKQQGDRFSSAAEVATLLEGCLTHVQQPVTNSLPDAVAKLNRAGTRRSSRIPYSNSLFSKAGLLMMFAFSILLVALAVNQDWPAGTSTVSYPPHRITVSGTDQLSADRLWEIWKEMPCEGREEEMREQQLTKLFEEETRDPNADDYSLRRKQWAVEILPIVMGGVPKSKAMYLRSFLQPTKRLQETNKATEAGQVSEPVDLELQTTFAVTLAQCGYWADCNREIGLLIRKLELLSEKHGEQHRVEYFGQTQTLASILIQCRLHAAAFEARSIQTMGQGDGSGQPEDDSESDPLLTKQNEQGRKPKTDEFKNALDDTNLTIEKQALSEIPNESLVEEGSNKALAVFRVKGNKLASKHLLDEECGPLGLAGWRRIQTLIPLGYRDTLVEFRIISGSDPVGFLNVSSLDRNGFALSIAKSLIEEEPDLDNLSRRPATRRGTLDWTIVHELGHYVCRRANCDPAFSTQFEADFNNPPPRRKNPQDYPEDGTPKLDGNYVTSYAERGGCDEEQAECFAAFVLVRELPKNQSLVARKLRFFAGFEGIPELRKYVQNVGAEK